MTNLILWAFVFLSIFGILNVLRWNLEKYNSRKYIGRGIFFILSFIFAYLYFNRYIISFSHQILAAMLISNSVGMFLAFDDNFFIKFKRDRYFLLFQSFNILFQQAMVIIGVMMAKEYFGANYHDYYFGIIFFLVHIPVLFLPWAKEKILYVIYALFAGIIFSFLITHNKTGAIFSFLLHYIVYIWLIYFIKDDRKI